MGQLRETIKQGLHASTLVEVLVASIIFLTVFILSLDTVVRITTKQPVKAYTYMLLLDEIENLRTRYTSGAHNTGTYSEEYDWGTVNIEISPYGEYDDINIIKLETDIPNTISNFNFTYLFENEL